MANAGTCPIAGAALGPPIRDQLVGVTDTPASSFSYGADAEAGATTVKVPLKPFTNIL